MKIKPIKKKLNALVQPALFTLAAVMITLTVNAQKPLVPQKVPGTDIYNAVEQQAQFPGGLKGFGEYLGRTIKYPKDARDKNVQGRVFLQFVVEKDGSLSNIKVIRGIGAGCDEEAMKAMENGPKWTPGKQDGQIVRSQFTVPIQFSLAKG